MRITSLSGKGLLSLDDFTLTFPDRVTFAFGPNGAGKSNAAGLLTVGQRAIEASDGSSREVARQLAAFVQAGHIGSASPGIDVRVAVKLTDPVEQVLMTEFMRAIITGALVGNRPVENLAEVLDGRRWCGRGRTVRGLPLDQADSSRRPHRPQASSPASGYRRVVRRQVGGAAAGRGSGYAGIWAYPAGIGAVVADLRPARDGPLGPDGPDAAVTRSDEEIEDGTLASKPVIQDVGTVTPAPCHRPAGGFDGHGAYRLLEEKVRRWT